MGIKVRVKESHSENRKNREGRRRRQERIATRLDGQKRKESQKQSKAKDEILTGKVEARENKR